MITNDEMTLSWAPTVNGPNVVRSLRVGRLNVSAGRLTVAPHHAGFLVHRIRATDTVASFVNTREWDTEWTIRTESFNARDVGCRFIDASRYVVGGREVSLWERTKKWWGTILPDPDELYATIERDRLPGSAMPPWKVVSCRAPTTDEQHVYVRVHWSIDLGSRGYYYENELVDRASVEVLSLQDGRWLRRLLVPYGSESSSGDAPLARDECRILDAHRFQLLRERAVLGVVAVADRFVIHDAAVLDDRLVVVTEDDVFAYAEIIP